MVGGTELRTFVVFSLYDGRIICVDFHRVALPVNSLAFEIMILHIRLGARVFVGGTLLFLACLSRWFHRNNAMR